MRIHPYEHRSYPKHKRKWAGSGSLSDRAGEAWRASSPRHRSGGETNQFIYQLHRSQGYRCVGTASVESMSAALRCPKLGAKRHSYSLNGILITTWPPSSLSPTNSYTDKDKDRVCDVYLQGAIKRIVFKNGHLPRCRAVKALNEFFLPKLRLCEGYKRWLGTSSSTFSLFHVQHDLVSCPDLRKCSHRRQALHWKVRSPSHRCDATSLTLSQPFSGLIAGCAKKVGNNASAIGLHRTYL